MDIVRYNDKEKVIIRQNIGEEEFLALMHKAKKRYGLKSSENPNGLYWPNYHKRIFYVRGFKFALEFVPEFDFFDKYYILKEPEYGSHKISTAEFPQL